MKCDAYSIEYASVNVNIDGFDLNFMASVMFSTNECSPEKGNWYLASIANFLISTLRPMSPAVLTPWRESERVTSPEFMWLLDK